MKRKIWVIATGILLLAVGTYLVCEKVAYVDPRECPVVLAYADSTNGKPQNIMIYDRTDGLRSVAKADRHLDTYFLLGYDRSSRAYLGTTGSDIVLIGDTKIGRAKLSRVPKDADQLRVFLRGNRLYLPSVQGGELLISCYDMAGKWIYERRIPVPGDSVTGLEYWDAVDIGGNGLVAASLLTANCPDAPTLYVFDGKGEIMNRIDMGVRPHLSSDGRRVACSWPGPRTVIHELSSGRERIFPERPPFEYVYPDLWLVGWTPDGKWLVYESELYVYGVSPCATGQRWCRLPFRLPREPKGRDYHTIVLDEAPSVAKNATEFLSLSSRSGRTPWRRSAWRPRSLR